MKRFIRAICDWWKKRQKWLRGMLVAMFIFVAIVPTMYRTVSRYTNYYVISIVPENDSLAVYAQNGKRGYMNVNTGEFAISARKNNYTKAWIFSEGLAAVMKDGKIGFINRKNEVVIPFEFDFVQTWWFDSAYMFQDGYCIMGKEDGSLGVIDTTGQWVIDPVYENIYRPCEDTKGWLVVKDNMYGVYDSDLNILFPEEYRYVFRLSDGYALVKDGRKWQVDLDGNVVYPFMFDMTFPLGCHYGCDECEETQCVPSIYMKYEIMGYYGIMNRVTGKPITPAIYSNVKMLSDELFAVEDDNGSYDWHTIDVNGNIMK